MTEETKFRLVIAIYVVIAAAVLFVAASFSASLPAWGGNLIVAASLVVGTMGFVWQWRRSAALEASPIVVHGCDRDVRRVFQLMRGLDFLVKAGVLRRRFAVIDDCGRYLGSLYASRADIPRGLLEECGGEIVAVFEVVATESAMWRTEGFGFLECDELK